LRRTFRNGSKKDHWRNALSYDVGGGGGDDGDDGDGDGDPVDGDTGNYCFFSTRASIPSHKGVPALFRRRNPYTLFFLCSSNK